MGKRADALADDFEQAVRDFAKTIEQCSDEQWKAVCNDEGWSVGVLAEHVAGQFPLEHEFISAAAEGRALPVYSWDDINGKNDGRAAKAGAATRADVLTQLREGSQWMSSYVRGLDDEQLDRKGPLGLANGAEVTTQQLIEGGVLIDHVRGHLKSIQSAT